MPEKRYYHPSDTTIDILVGASDGISIPFIVVSGLYGASFPSSLIAFIGTASAVFGGVVMLLTAYLTGRKQLKNVNIDSQQKEILNDIGLDDDVILKADSELQQEKKEFVKYAQEYELKTEYTHKQILISAIVIGLSYIIGGLIPILPFRFTYDERFAMIISTGITVVVLFLLGMFRAKITNQNVLAGALRLTIMSIVGACAAFYIVDLLL